ncbi:MAG: DUF1385 domain-containing protein [Clostridia bacterium]|nr:DUF1385 domain-containing protein [Clostridia bacterium]
MNIKGGRALYNGIAFTSKNNKAIGVIDENGESIIKIQERIIHKKILPKKIDKAISKLPFIRGVYFLFENKYMRIIFVISIMLSLLSNSSLVSENTHLIHLLIFFEAVFSIIILIILIKHFIKYKHVIAFHGAEHKVANTLWDKRELTLNEVRKSSRISEHCGSNLVIFWMVCQLLLLPFNFPEVLDILLGFSIAYELFKIKNGHKKPIISLFYKIGAFLQEKIVTREPNDKQIELAILIVQSLQKVEK